MYQTTTQDYRIRELQRQYVQAELSTYKWSCAFVGSCVFALSTMATGGWAFVSGYPVSGASAMFGLGVNIMLFFAIVGGAVSLYNKHRQESIRRDVATLAVDPDAWSARVRDSLEPNRQHIRANAYILTALAVLANVLGVALLISAW